MTLEEVLAVARLGAQQGCTEALFTLGTTGTLRGTRALPQAGLPFLTKRRAAAAAGARFGRPCCGVRAVPCTPEEHALAALHPSLHRRRRQARAALPRGSSRAGGHGLQQHAGLCGSRCRSCAARDRAAAARQRRWVCIEARKCLPGVWVEPGLCFSCGRCACPPVHPLGQPCLTGFQRRSWMWGTALRPCRRPRMLLRAHMPFTRSCLCPVLPGVMGREELRRLKAVSASQGLMLESSAEALLAPGGAHHNCPDKVCAWWKLPGRISADPAACSGAGLTTPLERSGPAPCLAGARRRRQCMQRPLSKWHCNVADPPSPQEAAVRLGTLEAAGQEAVPFTTGILIGQRGGGEEHCPHCACLAQGKREVLVIGCALRASSSSPRPVLPASLGPLFPVDVSF